MSTITELTTPDEGWITTGQHSMNPSTLLRLAQAFLDRGGKVRTREAHVLRIGADAGTWPGTVYKAAYLGYLERTRPAWFIPTDQLRFEIRHIEATRRHLT